MTATTSAQADVVVVGAGPYGLAAAEELRRRGRDVVAIGRPFSTWHEHTLDDMVLRSDSRASSIYSSDDRFALGRFLAAQGRKPLEVLPVDVFRAYLSDVESRLAVPLIRDEVVRLERRDGGFRAVCAGGGSVAAPSVVVATGVGPHHHFPRGVPSEKAIHSWDVAAIRRLESARVLVVGAGQSAAETVASLRARNRVTWCLRRRPLFFREPLRAPTPIFRALMAGSHLLFRLPPVILGPLTRPFFRTTVTPALRPVFDDPAVDKLIADVASLGLEAKAIGVCDRTGRSWDAVVCATGYRFSLRGLDFLDDDLVEALGGRDRVPRLDACFCSGVPGLYFTGAIAEPTHGPAMRFLIGARHAARRIAARSPRA